MRFRDSRSMFVSLFILGMLALSVLISTPARAQVVGATLSGTISDNSGAVIPNAQISIRNVATGVTRDITADSAGFYQAPNLDAGNYEVSVKAMGFKTAVQSGLTLTVGGQQALNVSMQVGEVSQTVSVTTEAPVVQLTSSSLGSLTNATTVAELPLNGRDWGALANLSPGVAAVQVQQTTGATVPKGNRGYGNQMTIAGTRPQMNNYRLDGISIVDYSGGTPASVISLTLGVDAIAEFSVVTSNHSAEYGRTSGGVINGITKSGTNQFHGDAYWFIRDEGFDARSATDKSTLPFHRNQFGGSIGGPIIKNKTFFFTNIEAFRQTRTTSYIEKVPSLNNRAGFVNSADIGNTTIVPIAGACPTGFTVPTGTAPTGFSPICMWTKALPFLALYPLPTSTAPNGDVGNASAGIPTVGSETYYTSRIDHTINSKDSLSGSFFIDTATFSQPDVLLTYLNGNTSRRTMITADETHIFSASLVNSLRIGYSRQHMVQNNFLSCLRPIGCDTSGSVSTVPGRPSPAINISGLDIAGGSHSVTVNTQIWNSYQLYDDAFLTKGTHSMKFGFVAEKMRQNPSNVQLVNGSWFNSSYIGFMQDAPQSMRMPAGSYGYPVLHQTLLGGYFQDDWRIKPNLTLNLGVRYEMTTVMTASNDNIMNLACISCTKTIIGNPLYHNPTLRNFEPRVGFAWDPFKDGKTSIRGAFGQFDVLPLTMDFFTDAQQTSPQAATLTSLGPSSLTGPAAATSLKPQNVFFPTLPIPIPTATAATGATPATVAFTEPNPKRSYVMVWNLSVQRQLSTNTSITVGYVANRGVHLPERWGTMNMNAPLGYDSAGYPYWAGGTVGGVNQVGAPNLINSQFPSIFGITWSGDSHYHGVEVEVNRKFSRGFQAQAGYTYGKNIDTNSATTISDPYLNSISTSWWFCKICRVGPSDFNITHKVTGNFVWDIPSPKFGGAFGSKILGGWELGDIINLTSGTPFSVMIAGDPEGTNSTDSPNSVYPNYTPGCKATNPGNKLNYINNSCFTLPTAPAGSNIACSNFGADKFGVGGIAGTCANHQGNAGRNMLTGPGLFDMDFSVIKNTKIPRISEAFNVQFRVEMFNVINHPSWQAPITPSLPNMFNADGTTNTSGGSLNVVTVPGREIQFGLKLIF